MDFILSIPGAGKNDVTKAADMVYTIRGMECMVNTVLTRSQNCLTTWVWAINGAVTKFCECSDSLFFIPKSLGVVSLTRVSPICGRKAWRTVLRAPKTRFWPQLARELTKSNETQRIYVKLRGEKDAIGPAASEALRWTLLAFFRNWPPFLR